MSEKKIELGFCTVIMAVYNGEKYIRDQLRSLFLQTRKPDEIIISDDGSTDRTCEIIQEEFARHPEIKTKLLYHQSEQDNEILGIEVPVHSSMFKCSRHFEFLARQATMQYVFFCDQDDVWNLEKVECFYQASREYPQAGLIFSNHQDVDENLKKVTVKNKHSILQRYLQTTLLPAEEFLAEEIRGNMAPGMCMCLRKDVLEKCIPFSYYTFHDYWCMLVAASQYPVVYIPRPLVQYRHHSSNVTASTGKRTTIESLKRHVRGYPETVWNDYSYMQDLRQRGIAIRLPDQFLEKQEDWYRIRLQYIRERKYFPYIKYTWRSYKLYKQYTGDPCFYIINDRLSILDGKLRRK